MEAWRICFVDAVNDGCSENLPLTVDVFGDLETKLGFVSFILPLFLSSAREEVGRGDCEGNFRGLFSGLFSFLGDDIEARRSFSAASATSAFNLVSIRSRSSRRKSKRATTPSPATTIMIEESGLKEE